MFVLPGLQDEASNIRGPLEEQGAQHVPFDAFNPTPDATPAEGPAVTSPPSRFDRQQHTTTKKPVQNSEATSNQTVIDVNINAGSAEQVCLLA